MQNQDEKLSILVIEDNEMFRRLALDMLSGHHLNSAKSAEEGLLAFKRYNPDIVFLDIGLPDEDGHYVLNRIMEEKREVFVVMLTASNLKEDVKKSMDSGAKGYIIKPFSRRRIKEIIEEYHKWKNRKKDGR